MNKSNVGLLLAQYAKLNGDHVAVAESTRENAGQKQKYPGWKTISYQELENYSNRIAAALQREGIQPQARIALLVPPGIEFVALVFALFKAGMVTILIDPGMGRDNLIDCLSEAKPQALIGVLKAQLARWLYRKRFPEIRQKILVGRGWFPGCKPLKKIADCSADSWHPATVDEQTPAAIIFTTGSTGAPKGVLYRHGNFVNQAQQIRTRFEIQPGGVDISGFPLFALFNAGMGVTTVFPKMDFTRPANVDPPTFLKAVDDWHAAQSFGSPALWNTVSLWCEKNNNRIKSLKKIFSAGAPVPPHVLQRLKNCLDSDAEVYTPYGATEALPVAEISGSEVLNETAKLSAQGAGTCVGRQFDGIRWKVIEITDQPLPDIQNVRELARGEIGELMVSGPVVTSEYITRTDANQLHKVRDGETFWHRMGDVGYLDDDDRFWFCGRKSHRVQTTDNVMYTILCEAIFNQHDAIYRSALVGLGPSGQQIPVIIVEPWPEKFPKTESAKQSLVKELRQLAAANNLTARINQFLIHPSFPVDIRHNSKIFREQLAKWAQQQCSTTAG
jgi:olefin beta-lactone synthetase